MITTVKARMIKVRRLGSNEHLTDMLSLSEAFDVLAEALKEGKVVYVEQWSNVIRDVATLKKEISRIESVIIIPPVSGG